MARNVILGNNSLTVGLNEDGLVHDFYYPYVGLENLTTARMQPHHVGVWIGDSFSWLTDDCWHKTINLEDDALVSDLTYKHKKLGITIHVSDFVDCNYDIFARKFRFKNHTDKKQSVRLFFHQVFQISALGRSDTVMYVPDGNYILDYKGRVSILAYAEAENGAPFDQYAAGNAGIEGKEGTFRDAEDGELSMSAVEHAGVDSTLRVCADIEPNGSQSIHYWLAVGASQNDLEVLHNKMLGHGFNDRLHATYQHWRDWLGISQPFVSQLDEKYIIPVNKSLMTIKAHIDKHGGIVASCDSSIYNYGRDYYSYVWPRDGAYVIWPLIKLGYTHEAKMFFEFCKSMIHPDGYLMHKYQPDRAIGSTWHPLVHGKRKELAIQEDETAIVVFMLHQYLLQTNDLAFVSNMYTSLIKPACDFMAHFIDVQTFLPHASYDLWEEKFLSSTYTAALTARSLQVGAEMAQMLGQVQDADAWALASTVINGKSTKGYYDTDRKALIKGFLWSPEELKVDKTLDVSSFFGAWKFDFATDEEKFNTLELIEKELLDISPSGGVARYENDNYFKSDPAYKGNPWFVTTLWLAQYYACNSQKDKAIHYVDWTIDHALSSGLLSEQVKPETGEIVGVTPLVWSHAELINAILDIQTN